MPIPDEAFIYNLRDTLFAQYTTLDKITEYIARKETRGMFAEHTLDIMDVRIEPQQDQVTIHYTLVTDHKVRFRTSYPMQWELFQEITQEPPKTGHNPWTLQDYKQDSRPFRGMVKVGGLSYRQVTPEEAFEILRNQAAAFGSEDPERK